MLISFFFFRYEKLNLKHEERDEIGIQCKRLIDMGRLDYLQKLGYQVELVSYIDKSISLENVALIGFYKESWFCVCVFMCECQWYFYIMHTH